MPGSPIGFLEDRLLSDNYSNAGPKAITPMLLALGGMKAGFGQAGLSHHSWNEKL